MQYISDDLKRVTKITQIGRDTVTRGQIKKVQNNRITTQGEGHAQIMMGAASLDINSVKEGVDKVQKNFSPQDEETIRQRQ